MLQHFPLFLAISGTAFAAQRSICAPSPAAACYSDTCNCVYCLGPVNEQGNAPVHPYTCNGDFTIRVAGFYWNAHEDGLTYAIENNVSIDSPDDPFSIPEVNNLVDARYKNPHFKWDFGFKIGLGYNTTCDGWDLGITWTWYRGKAFSHDETELSDNHILLPLWSAYSGAFAELPKLATDIQTHWKLKLNLVDLELGRQYWVSKYLNFRPFVGIRLAWIDQDFKIHHRGGSWDSVFVAAVLVQPNLNNEVRLENCFKGVGVRNGFDLDWNLGCGWSFHNNLALSILYGRFNIEQDECNRQATTPFTKTTVLETNEHFRSSRAIVDLDLGVQWHGLFCDCKYGITALVAWEQHLFFHQNQLWRVYRLLGDSGFLPNPTGENAFFQSRGTLSTQGWTLTLKLDF